MGTHQRTTGTGPARETPTAADAFRLHGAAVFGLARQLSGDRGLAEDIVQEVFLRYCRDTARFDPARGSLRAYLLADCRGRAIDRVRREASLRRREEAQAVQRPTAQYDLEGEVCRAHGADELLDALASLPSPERDAIDLAYYCGHTYREVAELLAVPEGTVKSRIRSGLGRLRADLGEMQTDAAV